MSLIAASRRTTFLPLITPAGPADASLTPEAVDASWSQVGPDLWSGIHGTEFLGTVDYADYTFTARNHVGTIIGNYDNLPDAQAEVLHPTGRAYLARHRISALLPAPARSIRGRATAAILSLTAATVAAVTLMMGTPHA